MTSWDDDPDTWDEDYEDDLGDDEDECPSCGQSGCPGYCDDYQTYNLRPGETGGEPDPDEDGHQRYKDDLAQGYINPDGTQRDPDPPEDYGDDERMNWLPRTEDGGADDPWAVPEHPEEAPF